MSNYKQLKSNPEYNISLVDIMGFFTKTNKAKYLELFCKLYKNKKIGNKKNTNYGILISKGFDIPQSEVDMLTSFSTYIHYLITEHMSEDIKTFQKFVNLNERGLIEKNDVLTYSSIDELKTEVSKSESKHIEKEMEKQVQKISDDEEWLILRPLTYESSKKYGSNTKWCTTHNERTYFDKYTKNGILIYFINKKTGVKVAVYKSLKHGDGNGLSSVAREFSFWDQKDIRIDSMESGLPDYIKSILMDEINNNPYTNLEVYAKRNKVQVPNDSELFKKRRTIGITETIINEDVQEPGGDVLPGMLPELDLDVLVNGNLEYQNEQRIERLDHLRQRIDNLTDDERLGRVTQSNLPPEVITEFEESLNRRRFNNLATTTHVSRIRNLMGLVNEQENVDLAEPTPENRQRLANLIRGVIDSREGYLNHLEEQRVQEANQEIEDDFINRVRQIEEDQQVLIDQDFVSEMESREDEDGAEFPEIDGEESEDIVEESEDIGEESEDIVVDDFATEMEERLGNRIQRSFTVTVGPSQLRDVLPMGRIVDNQFIPDESPDEQAG